MDLVYCIYSKHGDNEHADIKVMRGIYYFGYS